LADKVRAVRGVRSVSPVALSWVLISGPAKNQPSMLKGMDLEREKTISPWLGKLDRGTLPAASGKPGILLGRDLALTLGAGEGDSVTVVTAPLRLSPLGMIPRGRKFTVTGIFSTGLYEFDSATALLPLSTAQTFLAMPDRVSFLQVMIDDIFAAGRIKEALKPLLPPLAFVTTWMELNRSLFSALQLEKNIIFLTITLIVIVAALNIIATLILMVMEKTRDIGILIALGATSASIRKIFFLQGALIGVIGTALGTAVGLGWCVIANAFKLIKVPVDIYQISFIPFRIKTLDLLLIIGVSLAISPLHRLARASAVTLGSHGSRRWPAAGSYATAER